MCIGVNCVALVQFCKCFNESESLISLGYFPATPKKPNLAIDMQLFDLLEALLLECHVSVFDFVLALKSMTDVLYSYQVHEKHNIIIVMYGLQNRSDVKLYPVLIDSFEEYRHEHTLYRCTCTNISFIDFRKTNLRVDTW